jgi:uncharacterized membrane protein
MIGERASLNPPTKGPTMENVLAVNFAEDSKAYEALSLMKELDGQGQLELAGAAVVVRGDDGKVEIKDEVGDTGFEGTATGGIIGLLVGILGGPLGVLIGGATGLLLGSLYDMDDADETESALSDISRSVRPGRAALLAQVSEQSPDAVDAAIRRLDGTVLRRSLDDVRAEIAAAKDAQQAAKREARKQLREQRREQLTDKIRATIEELKAKLHRR